MEENGVIRDLRTEFVPPIDAALFTAIVSDYDLSQSKHETITQIRETLNALKDAAEAEETSGFDPSGTARVSGQEADSTIPDTSAASSCLSTRLSALKFEDASANSSETDFDEDFESSKNTVATAAEAHMNSLDLSSKQELLHDVFPSLSQFTVNHTLKKCDGIYGRAVEELLNHVFLEEGQDGEEPIGFKGVEGFVQANANARGRKNKTHGKKLKRSQGGDHDSRRSSSLPAAESGKQNKWEIGKQDIEFIRSRTGLPSNSVASAYNKVGMSLPATIRALIESAEGKHSEADSENPVLQANMFELTSKFPSASSHDLEALFRLTNLSLEATEDLVAVLTSPPAAVPGTVEIRTALPPIDAYHSSDEGVKKKKNQGNKKTGFNAHMLPTESSSGVESYAEATALADSYTLARHNAFTQAQAAYRKSKSTPLMGAAAAYYSSLGRDYDIKAKKNTSAAADAKARSQSSPSELDLHGIRVKDAVRIASERVSSWWAGLGEARYAPGRGSDRRFAFRIVTGVGRHSEGGRSKVGPAVARTLIREGWKIEVGEGVLWVNGVNK